MKQMMQEMDSLEYSHWLAFERVYGPIGDEWMAEAISSMHEQLQRLNYIQSQAHFTDKNHRRGPVPPPQKYPRPFESLTDASKFEEDADYSDEWLPPPEEGHSCPPNCVCKVGKTSSDETTEEGD